MITTAILVYLIIFPKFTFGSEPACSPYHYEEKTLEKMIRQEVAVERMKSDMEDIKRKVQDTLVDLDIEKRKLTVDLEEKTKAFEEVKSDMENAVADIKTRNDENIQKYSEEMERVKAAAVLPLVAFKTQKIRDTGLSNNKVIIFTENLLNKGGAYNNKTGIFVAPRGGVYLLSTQLCVGRNDYTHFGIFIGDKLVSSKIIGDHDWQTCSSFDAVAMVDQGEQVSVKCAYSCDSTEHIWITSDTPTNSFSGVLLHTITI